MIVANTTYYPDMPFDEYLALPGNSFSSIKNDGVPLPVSDGMLVGTRVHNYLLEPEKYDWQQPEIVQPIAKKIREILGDALPLLDKEIAFTSDFTHNGMTLKYKGRADMLKTGRIVIDLKVLGGYLPNAIERFGYHKQLSGYCFATGCPRGLIIAYNKATKKIETATIFPNADFWQYQCVHRGEPILIHN